MKGEGRRQQRAAFCRYPLRSLVDQRQIGVVYALGEIKEVITEPGLKFKLPPPFQNVVFLDKRIQTLDNSETRPIFTAEKKSLVIDWLVKWRIKEPRQFIRNNGTDFRNLENRLSPVVQAAFNEEITKRQVYGVLSVERDKIMRDVRARLADEVRDGDPVAALERGIVELFALLGKEFPYRQDDVNELDDGVSIAW